MVIVDPILDLMPIVLDKPLDRPSSSVPQGTDSMPLDLLSQLPKHIDFRVVGPPDFHSFESVGQPAGALPARRALPATLMLVELAEPQYSFDHVR